MCVCWPRLSVFSCLGYSLSGAICLVLLVYASMCFQSVQVRKRDSLWPHTKFHIIRLLSVWSSTSSVCSLSFGKLKLFEIPIYSAWVSPCLLEWNFTSRSSDWQLSQMMTQRHGLNAVGLYRCTRVSRVVTRIDTSVPSWCQHLGTVTRQYLTFLLASRVYSWKLFVEIRVSVSST